MDLVTTFSLLQILLILLIFAVGMPSLILQIGLDDRVARLVHKRLPRHGTQLAMLGGSLMVLAVLWLQNFSTGKLFIERLGGAANNYSLEKSIITVSLVAVVVLWRRLFTKDFRFELAEKLEKSVVIGTGQGPLLALDVLEDLLFLGEFSSAGYRKELVINTLARTAKRLQAAEGYEGSELSELIRGISSVVDNRTELGNDANYLQCGCVLADIWRRAGESKRGQGSDSVNCLQAMGRLGVLAVRRCTESTCREFLELVGSEPELHFEVGAAAVESGNWRIAIAAASRLEGLYRRKGRGITELVGLIGHFECAGGEAARYAGDVFKRLEGDAETVRRESREYFYRIGAFKTSGNLVS